MGKQKNTKKFTNFSLLFKISFVRAGTFYPIKYGNFKQKLSDIYSCSYQVSVQLYLILLLLFSSITIIIIITFAIMTIIIIITIIISEGTI